jgi:hypothetical protein
MQPVSEQLLVLHHVMYLEYVNKELRYHQWPLRRYQYHDFHHFHLHHLDHFSKMCCTHLLCPERSSLKTSRRGSSVDTGTGLDHGLRS